MNKTFLSLIFFLYFILPLKGEEKYVIDSARIDSSAVVQRYTDPGFFDTYKNSPEFDYYSGFETKTNTLWNRFWRWFWRMISRFFSNANGVYKGFGIILKVFFWLLIAAILIFAVRKINFQRFFYTRDESEQSKYIIDGDDEIIEDLEAAIAIEVDNKNFRKAIRYQFLNVLRKLDQSGTIQLSGEKTNVDYLNEIRKKTNSATEFQTLINIYNAVWYGHFTIDKKDYSGLSKSFIHFNPPAHA